MLVDIQPPGTDQGGKIFNRASVDASDRLDSPTENTEPETATVHHGQQAWARLRNHSTWEDWKAVGTAHLIGRTTAMREANTNKPEGRSYNSTFAAWARKFGFADLDKGDRCRLFQVMDHIGEIEDWLKTQTLADRLRFNHPAVILRRWKAATTNKTSEKKVSSVQKLKNSLINLQSENARMKREIERGGGDLWTADDRPQDIARVIVAQLSKGKAEKVAREILNTLKRPNSDAL